MLTIDFSPLYRSTIGFDRIAEALEIAERAGGGYEGYPPYNIEKTSDDGYRITMAVAGFTEPELTIAVEGRNLTIAGRHQADDDGRVTYLHRGIATRAFERRFQLADFVEVNSASLTNGLLTIDLQRELPEELRPRRIEIRSTGSPTFPQPPPKLIEGGAAKVP